MTANPHRYIARNSQVLIVHIASGDENVCAVAPDPATAQRAVALLTRADSQNAKRRYTASARTHAQVDSLIEWRDPYRLS